MKRTLIIIFLSFVANNLMAQSSEVKTKQKKNILSISLGIAEADVFNNRYSHKFGPAGSLEYQRIITPFIRDKVLIKK